MSYNNRKRKYDEDDSYHQDHSERSRNNSRRISRNFDDQLDSTNSPRKNQMEPTVANKRLFAGLLGHLGLAARQLKNDSRILEKQETILHTVSEKINNESKRIADLKKNTEMLQKKKEEKNRHIQDLQRKVDVLNQAVAKEEDFKLNRTQLIQTSSEPFIFWIPKSHNSMTTALLEESSQKTSEEYNHRIAKLSSQIQNLEKEIALQRAELSEDNCSFTGDVQPAELIEESCSTATDVAPSSQEDNEKQHLEAVIEDTTASKSEDHGDCVKTTQE